MVSPIRVGLVFGLFIGLAHVGWSALVATGYAQKLIDFIFWLHFIAPAMHVEAFDMTRAGILVAVTFGVAFVAGTVGGAMWNLFRRA